MKNFLRISGILILAVFVLSFTQSRTIKGKVTDESGNPLQGVTVNTKPPSANAVVTGADGSYSINTGSQAKKLVFSYIGYATVEIAIGDKNTIDVKMSPVAVALDEMVVVGYGSRKQSKAMYERSAAAPSSVMATGSAGFNRYNPNFNTEGYAAVNESGFRNVKSNPLSTFSIDVDNASYSNIRRFINSGQLPPADAVRIEEMINYFRYDYPEPHGEHPFSVYTELAKCPWNKSHQLLHVGLRGKSIDKESLPAANIVFLIDVSGSMAVPNKLPLLKSAFSLLVNELRPQDKVAIVVYAGAAGLVLPSTSGNRKEAILAAIDNLEAGGSTAGGEGLKLAYREAGKNFIKGGNNRIILATDGDFNVGESSNGGIERLVEEKRSLGVFITVLGFGMGNIKDDKMEIIADKGNGNYSYIDNLQEARKVLVSEFGGTLFTIAKDVKFQVEFNPEKVKSYRLIGYENRLLNEEDFNDDTKDAGEMGSGHNVTALYELVPDGSDEQTPAVDPLKYQSRAAVTRERNSYSDEYVTIKLRYKEPDGQTSRLFEKPVKGYVEDIEDASDNLRFAAAVSEFGMILRNSEFKGTATLDNAASLARSAKGNDEDGYRSEMIRLISTARDLRMTADK
ncbi:MAG TPA: von Willebrand factor type A domain-containing protein [Bacteroidales bacterium]|jgi:Ca-activated chloride channel family protein|nr:von Willebrand factor type A domain-containing protein [Bacteroidales bacterium]